MRCFDEIYETACLHKGGVHVVESSLPSAKRVNALLSTSDAEYLSIMSLRVFRSGLRHSMVDAKWPSFEKAFAHFDPFACAMMSDDQLEAHMANKALIRHLGKIKTIRHNAQFVQEIARQHESFGAFLAGWPVEQTIELWLFLRKHGSHLGGSSSGQFLRMAGKDTFLLSTDVVSVLMLEGVVDKAPSSQRDLKAVQSAFLTWREQSGRPLCEISRIVSMAAI